MAGRSETLALGANVRERRAARLAAGAAERAEERAQRAAVEERRRQQRTYAAAEITRLTSDWSTMLLSADVDLRTGIRRMRGAARSTVRDTAFGSRYVHWVEENVIGAKGIQLQAKTRTTRGELNDALNEKIEAEWACWCLSENASASGRWSWLALQRLTARTLPQDGEYILRMVPMADNPYLFALHPLDVDLIDDQLILDAAKTDNGNEIRMGVEIDQWERPIAYWMWTRHPTDLASIQSRYRIRVPASEILHDFVQTRPGQTRGVTWFAPVLINQQMLAAYVEAEITRARVAASNMGAVEFDPDKGGGSGGGVQPGQQPDQIPGQQTIPMELEPGRFLRLGPGEHLVATDIGGSAGGVGDFIKYSARTLAAGLNVAYSSLSGDLEAVNYSSIRAGIVSERDFARLIQGWLAERLSRRVFNAWLPYAVLAGRLPSIAIQACAQPRAIVWRPRGWSSVDPRNDIEAAHLAIALGVSSRTRFAAEQGNDFEELIDELAEEQEVADEKNVSINPLGLTVKGEDPNADPGGDQTEGGAKPGDAQPANPGRGRRGPLRAIRGA